MWLVTGILSPTHTHIPALKVNGAVAEFQQFVQFQVFDSHDAPSISI
jgi:hypothetical protein